MTEDDVFRPNDGMARIVLSPEQTARLKRLRQQSGIAPMRLLKGRTDIPQGLDSAIIQTWLNGKTGSARQDHYEYVLKLWQAVTPRIRLTDKDRETLKTEMARTGVGPKAILRLMHDKADNLKPIMISNWVNGKLETASADQWEALLTAYRSVPDQRS